MSYVTACTTIKQGRAIFSAMDLIYYCTTPEHTAQLSYFLFLSCFHSNKSKQRYLIFLRACYVPDTVVSNVNVLNHLILTP